MNLFELTAVITPLGGAIAAGRVAAPFGWWRGAMFSLGGLLLGLAVYLAVIGLSAGLEKFLQLDRHEEGGWATWVGLLLHLFMMAAPVVTAFAAAMLAQAILS